MSPPRHVRECESATKHWPAKVGEQEQRPVSVEGPGRSEDDARAWGPPGALARRHW